MPADPGQPDKLIHEPARLRILSILTGVDAADFSFLQSTLDLTKGNLSSHMDRLEKAEYVKVRKTFNGRVPHTEYRVTDMGRQALEDYWRSMDAIRSLQDSARELDRPNA